MAKTIVDKSVAFDPADKSRAKNWRFLAKVRERGPLVRIAEDRVFTASYEATARGFKDSRAFSSVGDMRAPGVEVPEEERFLGEIDAPLHPRIRRMLLKGFTRRAADASEGWTRDNVRRRLQRVADRGGGELMNGLAIPLPGSVAAHELGIPDERHDQVMSWCSELLHSTWPSHGRTERGVGIAGAFPEFAGYIDDLIAERRNATAEPEDLLGIMVRFVDDDGWRIGEQHIRTLAINILAGSLSASYMLGNLLYRYLADIDGFAATLRGDRSLIPVAVEESLRYEAPVMFLFRTAIVDTELAGCPVHKGDHVMLGIGSANRDESVYPDAESFRLDREDPPEHLAFGAGPHRCLGNHLTRMVGKVVLEEIIDGFAPGALELAPDFRWECVDHMLEYGPERLDVVVR